MSEEDEWEDYDSDEAEPVPLGIEATPEEIEGTVVRVSPQFWGDWGWAELTVGSNNRFRSKPLKFTGNIKGVVDLGARVILRGVWEETEKYGKTFRADLIAPAEVTGRDGVLSWLANNLPQIAAHRSAALYDRFGDSLWDILATEPERITEVPGITPERALAIQAAYLKYQSTLQTHLKLYSLGLSQIEILKVFKTKVHVDPDDIRVDPFSLYLKHGMTFARVEKIVAAKGLLVGASYPAAAASEATRRLCFEAGHTRVLVEDVRGSLMGDFGIYNVASAIDAAVESKQVIKDNDYLHPKWLHAAETDIASAVRRIRGANIPTA